MRRLRRRQDDSPVNTGGRPSKQSRASADRGEELDRLVERWHMELPDEALPAQRDSHLSCVRTRAAETWRVINLMRRRLSCANARVVPRHRLQHCHRVAEAQSVCLDVSAEVSTRTILADGNIAHVSRQDDLSERYAGENGTGVMHQGEFAKFHEERTSSAGRCEQLAIFYASCRCLYVYHFSCGVELFHFHATPLALARR